LLRQIESAEDVLAELGFRQFRVRHHGDVARIELAVADLPRAVERRAEILAGLRRAGYRHVTLDLEGFRRENPPASEPIVQLTSRAVAAPVIDP
ncbi:MAG TPA: hypothetical protein VLJ39_14295, partial [Tepidisphaeraceae bacterium]|nr:hypothetical protein [Tepidisphaeraceae bacterium]